MRRPSHNFSPENHFSSEFFSWKRNKNEGSVAVADENDEEKESSEVSAAKEQAQLEILRQALAAPDESERPVSPFPESQWPELDKQFRRLAGTRGLELNSPRTDILQGLVDKMLPDNKVSPQVIIMNKGHENEAFVYPDGKIFISQQIINQCRNLDEVGAILAHECGHLQLKTTQLITQAVSAGGRLGVSWAHEGVSDLMINENLSRAGLSTLGAKVSSRVLGEERLGLSHMAGGVRSSMIAATQRAVDYGEASERAATPLPEDLLRQPEPTNLEIARDLITTVGWGEGLENFINKLDNYDFGLFLRGSSKWDQGVFRDSGLEKSSSCLFQELKSRAERLGIFDDAITKVYLTAWAAHFFPERLNRSYGQKEYKWPFLDGEDLKETEFIPLPQKFLDLEEKMFDGAADFHPLQTAPILYRILSVSAYDAGKYSSKKEGVGFTQISDLLTALSKIPRDAIAHNEDGSYSRDLNFRVLYRWLLTSITSRQEKSLVLDKDYEQEISAAAQEITASGVEFSRNGIDSKLWLQDANLNIIDGEGWASIESDDAKKVLQTLTAALGLKTETVEQKETDIVDFGTRKIKKRLETLNLYHEYFSLDNWLIPDLQEDFSKLNRDLRNNSGEQLKLMEGVDEILQTWEMDSSVLKSLYFNLTGQKDFQDSETATKLVKVTLREVLGSEVFTSDSPEYYSWQAREPFGSWDWNKGSIALLKRLVIRISHGLKKTNDPTAFSDLPIIKEYLSRPDDVEFSSQPDNINSITYLNNFDIFELTPASILLGRNHRENLLKQLNSEWEEQDFNKLYAMVNYNIPAGSEKRRWLAAINLKYLKSGRASFPEKVQYLEENIVQVGTEGILTMADQATTQQDFLHLREKTGNAAKVFLYENQYSTFGAVADYATSKLISNVSAAERLVETCAADEKTVTKNSTAVVSFWFQEYLNAFNEVAGDSSLVYDRGSEKFWIDEKQTTKFRSPRDTFERLNQASGTERFVSLLKTLVDDGGALNSSDGREKLSQLATERLNLSGFMKELFSSLLLKGEREQVSVPLASLLTPLLFRGLDIDKVDYDKLAKDLSENRHAYKGWFEIDDDLYPEDLTAAEIKKITTGTTRTLTNFGANYRNHPDCALTAEAQKSWEIYQQVGDRLNELLTETSTAEADPRLEKKGISTAEGLIRAGETNPLTNRAMQLAVQLFPELTPELREQMSECLDANPVVNKWMYWENLLRLQERANNTGNNELADNISKIKEVGDRAGAGSLFTTYFGQYETAAGDNRPVVIKLLNPNPVRQVKDNFASLFTALKDVMANSEDRKIVNIAGKCKQILTMTYKWCLRDIRDTNFMTDDAGFRETASGFNTKVGREAIRVPEVYVNDKRLKIEDRASGQTLKEFLKNDAVTPAQKNETRQLVRDFYEYQMTRPTPDGNFIIHSDPHAGNFIVELDADGRPLLNIIDRSMYLRFREESLKPFRELLAKNSTQFVRDYVGGLCRRRPGSTVANLRVYARVTAALAKEKMRRGDDLDMLIAVNDALAKSGVEVPLDWQLLVRNVRLVNEINTSPQ
jgi:hypothetical protein